MKIKKILTLLSMVVVAFSLTACSTNVDGNAEETTQQKNNTLITIKHELDEVTLNVNPERVVVFDYGILDSIDTLGINVVGLPKATLPEYLNKYNGEEYTDLGSLKEPNFEKIYELKPDVIFISGRQVDLYDEFKEIAPTLYVPLNGDDYFNSFKSNMSVLAQVFDKEDKINEKIISIEQSIKELNEKVTASGKNAIFLMANEGSMSVYGLGSRYGFIYDEFGFAPADENIESGTHGQKISYEYLIEKNPDYIFVLDRGAVATTGGENLSAENLMNNELMKSTKAYKEGNIVYVNSHVWYVATGGINGTITMVNEVANSLK